MLENHDRSYFSNPLEEPSKGPLTIIKAAEALHGAAQGRLQQPRDWIRNVLKGLGCRVFGL